MLDLFHYRESNDEVHNCNSHQIEILTFHCAEIACSHSTGTLVSCRLSPYALSCEHEHFPSSSNFQTRFAMHIFRAPFVGEKAFDEAALIMIITSRWERSSHPLTKSDKTEHFGRKMLNIFEAIWDMFRASAQCIILTWANLIFSPYLTSSCRNNLFMQIYNP